MNYFNSVPADRRQQVVAGFIGCNNAEADPGDRLRYDSEECLNKSILDFSEHGRQKAWFLPAFTDNGLRHRPWRHVLVPQEPLRFAEVP